MTDLKSLLESYLSPSVALVEDVKKIEGDIMILGVGGKMGPALAVLTKQAIDSAGLDKKVYGVSRFSEPGLREQMEDAGIETIAADLLDDEQLNALPEVPNVLYLAGTKFGTKGNESFTWTMNAYLPGRVAQKFRESRIVAFSTGNVYPLTPVLEGGATEKSAPGPVGEYAQSCLGRERLFQYYAAKNSTPVLIYRLNYANDVSYGVLLEIAKSVREGRDIDLRMGHVNVIWQGDANEIAIRSLLHCQVPAVPLNVTGPETASVRWIAKQFAEIFSVEPKFTGQEEFTALLSNATECFGKFGYPRVTLHQMIQLIGRWLIEGGETKNKPSHFQERQGQF